MNYKIRKYQTEKIPYTLILGDTERDNKTVTFRRYGSEENTTLPLADFIELLQTETKF